MSERRNVTRQLARERRLKRRDLVWIAGWAGLIGDRDFTTIGRLAREAVRLGIRIPRSIAQQHGLEER